MLVILIIFRKSAIKTPFLLYIIYIQEVEVKHLGSKDSIGSKIDMDTKVKIEAMNRSVAQNKVKFLSSSNSFEQKNGKKGL